MGAKEDSKSWARKYRPKGLSEYLGADVKSTLDARFNNPDHRPQVVLLHGPRGTGKTTAARLLAKDYQCLNPVDGHACGECEMCQELDQKLINSEPGVEPQGVSEIDIAAEGSKRNIDDIIDQAILEPMPPIKYKILILDEFHMANKAVQNRLLKIMEEPPSHLCLFLCTTNPESILPTILSRCQVKIAVHKAHIEELAGRLMFICQQERVTTSMAALRVIAKQADRVPREAITLLEDIALGNGLKVDLAAIQRTTGAVANEVYIGYFKAANSSLEDIIGFVAKLKNSDTSFKEFITGLTRFTLDSMRIRYAIGLEDYSPQYVKAIKELFKIYSTEEMDCLLQIIEYANKLVYDNEDTKEELAIITTAMRIGRVRLLNNGLADESTVAARENKKASAEYSKEHSSELKSMNHSVRTGSTDSMVASVFGKQTVMVTEKPALLPTSMPPIGLEPEQQIADEDDEDFFKRFLKDEQ